VNAALPLFGNLCMLALERRVAVEARVNPFHLRIDNGCRNWLGWSSRGGLGRDLGRLVTGLTDIIWATGVIVWNLGRAANALLVTGQAILAADERMRDGRRSLFCGGRFSLG
jgi:hypothetical protein